jgi:hypothetical protein
MKIETNIPLFDSKTINFVTKLSINVTYLLIIGISDTFFVLLATFEILNGC